MLNKIDWDAVPIQDKANLYYMTCILQTVIDLSEEDMRYFDETYAFTVDFNMHSYGSTSVKLSFSSKGIRIYNNDEELVRKTINMFNHNNRSIDEVIELVADDLAESISYKNDFDRYQHVDRNDAIYYRYFNYYKDIATKLLK